MIAVVLLFLGVIALYLANEGQADEVWVCDDCGAPCDVEMGYCECDPAVCSYPPVHR